MSKKQPNSVEITAIAGARESALIAAKSAYVTELVFAADKAREHGDHAQEAKLLREALEFECRFSQLTGAA